MRIEGRDSETLNYSKILYAKNMDRMILEIRGWLKHRGVRKYALTVLDDLTDFKQLKNEKHKGH